MFDPFISHFHSASVDGLGESRGRGWLGRKDAGRNIDSVLVIGAIMAVIATSAADVAKNASPEGQCLAAPS